MTPREAAYRTMDEVSGALIAIGLVLLAVFVPTAFVSGIPGEFYRQFAVTISAAALISLLVSLTLSPALAALLLKPHVEHGPDHGPRWLRPIKKVGDKFNRGFDWLSDRYGRLTARLIRASVMVLIVYVGLVALTGWRLSATPSRLHPEQDQGFLIGVVQLPPGASLERTDAVIQKVTATVLKMDGVETAASFAGLDGASFSSASNAGTVFVKLKDWSERSKEQSANALAGAVMGALGNVEEANIFVLSPPPVQGLGNGGGFKMMVQDRSGAGYKALEASMGGLLGPANAPGGKTMAVFSTFNTGSPRITANVDRDRALQLGVQPSEVFATMGTYLGSTYVNDFNMLGRTFRVTAQAEPGSRSDQDDIANLQVRSMDGAMVPLGSVATLTPDTGPVRVVRHNLFRPPKCRARPRPGSHPATLSSRWRRWPRICRKALAMSGPNWPTSRRRRATRRCSCS